MTWSRLLLSVNCRSTGDMVLQLSLLAVRKHYRHLGIGSYIMEVNTYTNEFCLDLLNPLVLVLLCKWYCISVLLCLYKLFNEHSLESCILHRHCPLLFAFIIIFLCLLFQLLKTQSVVGKYDTLVAHADTDAIGFFKFHGLTNDPLLNDQFKYI